jgi:hypothetical protein
MNQVYTSAEIMKMYRDGFITTAEKNFMLRQLKANIAWMFRKTNTLVRN